jgi:hypothetical protein
MATLGDEALKALSRVRNRVRRRNSDAVEAVPVRGISERAFDRGRIGQKSRSA